MADDQVRDRRNALTLGVGLANLAVSPNPESDDESPSYELVRTLLDYFGLQRVVIPDDKERRKNMLGTVRSILDIQGLIIEGKCVRLGWLLALIDEDAISTEDLVRVKSMAGEVGIRGESIDRLLSRRRSIRQADQAEILIDEIDRMGRESISGAGPTIFISHSSEDKDAASALVELLLMSFKLPASAIRCTSVPGYGLPIGVSIESVLRGDVGGADVFIGLLSTKSLRSLYVLFELGARWGASRPILPVLLSDVEFSELKGPLSSIHAVKLSDASAGYQLVTEVGKILAVTPESPESLSRYVEKLAQSASSSGLDIGGS